jgi:DNA helicase II / ATP-dependent DNA helicase PcrA
MVQTGGPSTGLPSLRLEIATPTPRALTHNRGVAGPLPFDISSLNPNQREAVEWPGGPLKIIAGAGSGKTRVVTCRIARLLSEGVHPARILAVTFTNKAAKEMKERLEGMVGGRARSLWVGTFHSVCARILRMEGSAIGLSQNFVVYDDGDQLSLVKEIIKARGYDEKSIQPRAVLAAISRAKEKLLGPEGYQRTVDGFFEQVVAKIYPDYQKSLERANALDFDDIIFKTVRLLEQSQAVKEKLQERFMHVMVDEYQDVNYSQYRLADELAGLHKNLTVVGDDDQSIYAWRGADVSLMLRFSSDHPDAKIVTLDQNYRSTKTILEAAYQVVRHNRGRLDKKLWTDKEGGAMISLLEGGTENDEASIVADHVVRLVRTGRRAYGDFAVLYRTNAMSRVVEEAFLSMRVPHLLVGGQRFYDRKEIKDMIAYLRLSYNPSDDAGFRRIVNVPARGIGSKTVELIDKAAQEQSISLFAAASKPEFRQTLPVKTRSSLASLVTALQTANELAEAGPVTPVLNHLLNATGYVDELRLDRSDEAVSRLENLQELVNVTAQYDRTAEDGPTLGGFLENVALAADTDALVESGDAVTLMTLHSSKGLEFPVVFLMGMEEGVFPHSRSFGNETELEEERRLCYVGMTRAQEELHLTLAQRRSIYGQPNFNPPSRFLEDIPRTLIDLPSGSLMDSPRGLTSVRQERSGGYTVTEPRRGPVMADDRDEAPSGWTPPFKVGEKVTHRKFGLGVVVACGPTKNDSEVTVAFPGETGIKKMLQGIAKLEKVT